MVRQPDVYINRSGVFVARIVGNNLRSRAIDRALKPLGFDSENLHTLLFGFDRLPFISDSNQPPSCFWARKEHVVERQGHVNGIPTSIYDIEYHFAAIRRPGDIHEVITRTFEIMFGEVGSATLHVVPTRRRRDRYYPIENKAIDIPFGPGILGIFSPGRQINAWTNFGNPFQYKDFRFRGKYFTAPNPYAERGAVDVTRQLT